MEKPIKTVHNDIPTLLRDAQRLIREAATVSGDKATELRQQAEALMEEATNKAIAVKNAGIDFIETADQSVKTNPYKSMLVALGIGVIVGTLLNLSDDKE